MIGYVSRIEKESNRALPHKTVTRAIKGGAGYV